MPFTNLAITSSINRLTTYVIISEIYATTEIPYKTKTAAFLLVSYAHHTYPPI